MEIRTLNYALISRCFLTFFLIRHSVYELAKCQKSFSSKCLFGLQNSCVNFCTTTNANSPIEMVTIQNRISERITFEIFTFITRNLMFCFLSLNKYSSAGHNRHLSSLIRLVYRSFFEEVAARDNLLSIRNKSGREAAIIIFQLLS